MTIYTTYDKHAKVTVTKQEYITEKTNTTQEQYTKGTKTKQKNSYNITGKNSPSNILMAAPSSTPRDHHLVRDPRKQTATAWSKEKASFKRIQHKTSEKL